MDRIMKESDLKWEKTGERKLLHTPVYDVIEQTETSASGLEGKYVAMTAPDWVMVIPETDGKFVLVRQWRHAAERLTLEFPGGVSEAGEDPAVTAARELEEETGYHAGSVRVIGVTNPNPALFKNRAIVCLAENLVKTDKTDPDEDEFINVELRDTDDVIDGFGQGEFIHALMGTAISFYLKEKRKNNG